MIIGDGLIGGLLKKTGEFDSDEYIIVASGVSNSNCQDTSQFIREVDLIDSLLSLQKKIIYFSTLSIYDQTKIASKYILHKIALEKKILETSATSIVLRLPNLIGIPQVLNNTMISFFFKSIFIHKKLILTENPSRFVVVVDDLIPVLKKILQNKALEGSSVNVFPLKQYDYVTLFTAVNSALETVTPIIYKEGGYSYYLNYIDRFDWGDELDKKYNNIDFLSDYISFRRQLINQLFL
jgi:nucleoside-diphosphate-sugar epimerase